MPVVPPPLCRSEEGLRRANPTLHCNSELTLLVHGSSHSALLHVCCPIFHSPILSYPTELFYNSWLDGRIVSDLFMQCNLSVHPISVGVPWVQAQPPMPAQPALTSELSRDSANNNISGFVHFSRRTH